AGPGRLDGGAVHTGRCGGNPRTAADRWDRNHVLPLREQRKIHAAHGKCEPAPARPAAVLASVPDRVARSHLSAEPDSTRGLPGLRGIDIVALAAAAAAGGQFIYRAVPRAGNRFHKRHISYSWSCRRKLGHAWGNGRLPVPASRPVAALLAGWRRVEG